jgi:UDPglucose--hexose-1-phosphate uridylyltransferase
MIKLDLQQHPHRRYNPLTREWILVSPHRTQRPWQGQTEKANAGTELEYDPQCYMCPGNVRANGERNPAYGGVFTFDNDYPALMAETPQSEYKSGDLILARGEPGICRVMCFSPRHDLTLARMTLSDVRQVVEVWAREYQELSALPWIKYVQIFENRGAMMGCSNPHPHCQIWSTSTIPTHPVTEQLAFDEHERKHGVCLLCDYEERERVLGERIICQNDDFLALVPFWATWPFETMLLSKRHVTDIAALRSSERLALAEILNRLTVRYDNLFQTSFPYSMGFHQRPSDGAHPEWHFHAHFFPPLLRSATVRKFSVGYELLAASQRDITPETAAERLRALSEQHFSLVGTDSSH